jgi:hypothetical protein
MSATRNALTRFTCPGCSRKTEALENPFCRCGDPQRPAMRMLDQFELISYLRRNRLTGTGGC